MPHQKATPWRPLLEGDLARRAWQAIDAVTSDLEKRRQELTAVSRSVGQPSDPTLAGGSSGLALYFSYLAEARAGEDVSETYADEAMHYLEHAMDAFQDEPMPASLYSGFPGIGWVVAHLDGRLFESDDDPEIDAGVVEALGRGSWRGDYDLINGLAGIAVYALEALPLPSARRCLELVVDRLEELAIPLPGGRSWFTPPELLGQLHLKKCPDGYFNLGLAHGIPAVLAVLACIGAAGIEEERIHRILGEAVPWFLAQELPDAARSSFSNWTAEGYEPEVSRVAWCYGDLGIAAALLLTARRTGRADWEGEALRIARGVAAREPATSGVVDAGLCHGAAGAGHLFHRLYQASGDEALGRAAIFWFEHALELRKSGEGIGGFLSCVPLETGEPRWREDPGFLMGSAGTALALLGAVTDVEPAWDRVLLTSIPPRSAAS